MSDVEKVIESENVLKSEIAPILDNLRGAFAKKINLMRYLGYGIAAIVFMVVVVSYVVIMQHTQMGAIILIILALIGSFVFSVLNRRKQEGIIRQYMFEYNDVINKELVANQEISEYMFDYTDGLDTKAFVEAKVLEEVSDSASRNLVSYKLGDFEVKHADYVAYKREGKRVASVFAGKLLVATRSKTISSQVVLYIKPDNEHFPDTKQPEIAHLKVVENNDEYTIYAEGAYKRTLPEAAIKQLIAIKRSNNLADLTVSLLENKVTILMSYGKDIISVPYREAVPHEAINQYIANTAIVHKFLNLIN